MQFFKDLLFGAPKEPIKNSSTPPSTSVAPPPVAKVESTPTKPIVKKEVTEDIDFFVPSSHDNTSFFTEETNWLFTSPTLREQREKRTVAELYEKPEVIEQEDNVVDTTEQVQDKKIQQDVDILSHADQLSATGIEIVSVDTQEKKIIKNLADLPLNEKYTTSSGNSLTRISDTEIIVAEKRISFKISKPLELRDSTTFSHQIKKQIIEEISTNAKEPSIKSTLFGESVNRSNTEDIFSTKPKPVETKPSAITATKIQLPPPKVIPKKEEIKKSRDNDPLSLLLSNDEDDEIFSFKKKSGSINVQKPTIFSTPSTITTDNTATITSNVTKKPVKSLFDDFDNDDGGLFASLSSSVPKKIDQVEESKRKEEEESKKRQLVEEEEWKRIEAEEAAKHKEEESTLHSQQESSSQFNDKAEKEEEERKKRQIAEEEEWRRIEEEERKLKEENEKKLTQPTLDDISAKPKYRKPSDLFANDEEEKKASVLSKQEEEERKNRQLAEEQERKRIEEEDRKKKSEEEKRKSQAPPKKSLFSDVHFDSDDLFSEFAALESKDKKAKEDPIMRAKEDEEKKKREEEERRALLRKQAEEQLKKEE